MTVLFLTVKQIKYLIISTNHIRLITVILIKGLSNENAWRIPAVSLLFGKSCLSKVGAIYLFLDYVDDFLYLFEDLILSAK